MRNITLILLLTAPLLANATPPDLNQVLPDKLEAAIQLMDSVRDKLPPPDYFSTFGFIIRASWCDKAGRPIHRGMTIRQAIDLEGALNRNGGDLFKPANVKVPADVRRVCGEAGGGS